MERALVSGQNLVLIRSLPLCSMKLLSRCLALASVSLASTLLAAEAAKIQVKADAPGAQINPAMWGVFFEDINFGADGGLYAELVKNGSFEFPDARVAWKRIGGKQADEHVLFVQRNDAGPANKRFAEMHNDEGTAYGLSNEGFRGIGVREGDLYDFSIDLRSNSATPQKLKIELLGAKGSLASAVIEATPGTWTTTKLSLTPNATEAKASLVLTAQSAGSLSVDRVSLFPRKTWKNRPQGLRADMVQMLADMKPGFLRFPGGCIVEGHNLALRYQWKKTILPREERELLINRWNTEVRDRQAPDYFQSFGLGFFEYFQLCEDLGAQPLPIINCGMALPIQQQRTRADGGPRSLYPGRSRSDRICQRPRHLDLGLQTRRPRPSCSLQA